MNFQLWKFTRCLFRAIKKKTGPDKTKIVENFKLVPTTNLKFQVKRFE